MSSMNRNSSRPGGTKKKFGKNLNKVTKAPAPPIASANARGATSSSRNGLLLLSTKRASSSGTATASGGLLSSKTTSSPTKPLQPLGLTTESYSSAHDALLGAVIGASRMTDTQQPPDAWGVAEKQTSSAPEPALAPKGGVSSGVTSYYPADHVPTDSMDSPKRSSANESDVAATAGNQTRERRRAEEEMRFNEQKERAAERLRELEKKLSTEKPQAPVPVPMVVTQRPSESVDPVVLKTLNHRPCDTNGMEEDNGARGERARPRTLFDPNRPYSSLVSGKSDEGSGEEGVKEGRRGSPTVDQEYSRSAGVSRVSRNGADRDEEQPSQPVIHISSYETRDRGERDNNAGPRMLFDPKSGSMVAAPCRDEGAGSRGKKGKPKGRKDRASSRDSAEGDDGPFNGTKLKRSKGRKDDKRDRKRAEDDDVSPKESFKKRGGKLRPAEDRLPRTCGVLYKRDEHGNFICVDGCDGDQGYGGHSVPGGRIRNPVEHAKFVEQQEAYQQEGANELAFGMAGYDEARAYYGSKDSTFGSPTQEPEMVQEEIWVKPDEKIELVTGLNDSPTLQATASTWVPSQAALAAAAAARKEEIASRRVPVDPDMTSDEEDSDEEEEHPVSVGLCILRRYLRLCCIFSFLFTVFCRTRVRSY